MPLDYTFKIVKWQICMLHIFYHIQRRRDRHSLCYFLASWPLLSAQSTDNTHIGTGDNQTAGGDKHEDERQHIKDERENQDPCRHEQPYHPKWTPPRFLRIREN